MEVGVNEKAEVESMTGRLQNSVKINGERRVVEFSKLLRRPITRTSVLEGLSESKLADIQLETLEKTAWSWLTETVKSSGEKKTKSWA